MRPRALAVATCVCLLLAGRAPRVALKPAPKASTAECASVIGRLRTITAIGPAERRNTDAQGTAASGTPASGTLRCGVTTPQASALRCFTLDGVDWLDQTVHGTRVLTTYGRSPGVQVVITPPSSVSDTAQELTPAVEAGTRGTNKICLSGTGHTARPPT